jgi:hypothetical protein
MLDYNTRQLAAWVLKEFRAQLLLAAAGALATGYAFGCFSKARLPRGGEISVFALNGKPARYNARTVCVTGSLLNIKSASDEPAPPYAVFSLKESGASGDYDFINILSFNEREAPAGNPVTACGIFSAVKQVGKDTYHNVIFLNRFLSSGTGPEESPLAGARRSRSF